MLQYDIFVRCVAEHDVFMQVETRLFAAAGALCVDRQFVSVCSAADVMYICSLLDRYTSPLSSLQARVNLQTAEPNVTRVAYRQTRMIICTKKRFSLLSRA